MTTDIAESVPTAVSPDTLDQLLREPASLDPKVLLVEDNVRETFDATFESDPELVELLASVREHGVTTPVIAELSPEGGISVVEGQLRTLAARKAGLDAIPAWVRRGSDLDENTRRLARITEQVVANDRRVALTGSDRAKAVAQMLDLGMSVTKVSKAIQLKREVVKSTATVGKSPTARRLLDEGALSLAQLEVIAEFENAGDTEAVERLERTDARDFDWTANFLRDERELARARRAVALTYTEQGYRVLTDDDFPQADLDYVPIEDVRTLDGDEVTPAATREHPAVWAVYLEHMGDELDITDAETGVPVDPETVDWDTDTDRSAEAAAGLRHADTVTQSPWRPWFYIRPEDMAAAAVMPTPPADEVDAAQPDPVPASTGYHDDPAIHVAEADVESIADEDSGGEVVAEDPAEAERREAARVEAQRLAAEQAASVEAARLEAQRLAVERREAERAAGERIDKLGKQAVSVNKARRDWLGEHVVARKALTKDEAQFVAASLLRNPELLSQYGAADLALRLLGFDSAEAAAASLTDATRGRADVYVYVLVLAGYERLITKDLWRLHTIAPKPGNRDTRGDVEFYLRFLASRSYPLVAVELAGLGELDPDSIQIDI